MGLLIAGFIEGVCYLMLLTLVDVINFVMPLYKDDRIE